MEEIIRLRPYFSHTIWGGSRLREEFGYPEPGEDIGECWGISAHPNGDDTVVGGAFDGQKLSSLWDSHRELFGNLEGDRFPLLVKIIDAKADLSIQVHPDDAYAGEHENGSLGKTECWYVLDCPEDGRLVVGHNARTAEELREMIAQGRWKDFLREIPVRPGDFIQIDPGTVHAIKGGVMVLETQQSSDITYRVYDYDRLQNGKPRPLHLSQSLDVITVPARSVQDTIVHAQHTPENQLFTLCSGRYYTVSKLVVRDLCSVETHAPFLNFTVYSGSGMLNGTPVRKGDHLILTSAVHQLRMTGSFEAIVSHV